MGSKTALMAMKMYTWTEQPVSSINYKNLIK